MTTTIVLHDTGGVEIHLQAAADELEVQWAAALVTGDFSEIDRIVEASHAVQRALIALESDRLVSTG